MHYEDPKTQPNTTVVKCPDGQTTIGELVKLFLERYHQLGDHGTRLKADQVTLRDQVCKIQGGRVWYGMVWYKKENIFYFSDSSSDSKIINGFFLVYLVVEGFTK